MENKELTEPVINEENIKQQIASCERSVEISNEKKMIYRLALKGLLGDVSEYIVEKLLNIANAMREEDLNIEWQTRRLKELQENK